MERQCTQLQASVFQSWSTTHLYRIHLFLVELEVPNCRILDTVVVCNQQLHDNLFKFLVRRSARKLTKSQKNNILTAPTKYIVMILINNVNFQSHGRFEYNQTWKKQNFQFLWAISYYFHWKQNRKILTHECNKMENCKNDHNQIDWINTQIVRSHLTNMKAHQRKPNNWQNASRCFCEK
jgi:hypothetical protein